jgi:phosphoglycolate phosphatase-like HAD superfamily hydrolase
LKAIVLDIDGTLIESMAVDSVLFFSSISAVLGSVDFRENLNDYDHVTDNGIITQVMEDNALPLDQNAIDSIRSRFVAGLTEHIETDGPFPMIPGAAQFVDKLRTSIEHDVAIATGGWRLSALLKLETSGLDVEGIPIFSCDDAPSRTEIMRIALSKLGNEYESVTYFGDAEWDRRACEALGWGFVPVGSDLGGIETYDNFSV